MAARRALIGVLVACGGGAPPPPPVTALPPPTVIARPPPVAPATIAITSVPAGEEMECTKSNLVVRAHRGAQTLGEETLEGSCHGACTEEEQREGAARLRKIEAAIRRGKASESETDYNFTECQYTGHAVIGRHDVAGRTVVLIEQEYIGPHDVLQSRFLLAFEHCDQLVVTDAFAERYVSIDSDALAIRAVGKVLEVTLDDEPTFQVDLATCTPVATELD